MRYRVDAYPYARQTGSVEVPDNVPEDKAMEWIQENWDKVKFSDDLDLDYAGTDFEIEKE